MSNAIDKKGQALEACNKVINGIEDETISVSSALLQCMKIARLVNDFAAQEWLSYEYGGYPRTNDGHVVHEAWQCAKAHGRGYVEKGNEYIFSTLASELEGSISSSAQAVNNFSTSGVSVSGDISIAAMREFTSTVSKNTGTLITNIQTAQKRLSILKSQYYNYAVKWQIQLQFGSVAASIFSEYQDQVNLHFSTLTTQTLQKLQAIETLMDNGNPEQYSQVLTTCRRLWQDTAEQLFERHLPNYTESKYKTKSGKEIDVSGDHYNNKMSAVIETLQNKAAKNTIVGSGIIYFIDWMEQIHNQQCAGVHAEITRKQARQCIIHTYVCLGDLLSMMDE